MRQNCEDIHLDNEHDVIRGQLDGDAIHVVNDGYDKNIEITPDGESVVQPGWEEVTKKIIDDLMLDSGEDNVENGNLVVDFERVQEAIKNSDLVSVEDEEAARRKSRLLLEYLVFEKSIYDSQGDELVILQVPEEHDDPNKIAHWASFVDLTIEKVQSTIDTIKAKDKSIRNTVDQLGDFHDIDFEQSDQQVINDVTEDLEKFGEEPGIPSPDRIYRDKWGVPQVEPPEEVAEINEDEYIHKYKRAAFLKEAIRPSEELSTEEITKELTRAIVELEDRLRGYIGRSEALRFQILKGEANVEEVRRQIAQAGQLLEQSFNAETAFEQDNPEELTRSLEEISETVEVSTKEPDEEEIDHKSEEEEDVQEPEESLEEIFSGEQP